MGINKNELTAEQIRKAMECEDASELMESAPLANVPFAI